MSKKRTNPPHFAPDHAKKHPHYAAANKTNRPQHPWNEIEDKNLATEIPKLIDNHLDRGCTAAVLNRCSNTKRPSLEKVCLYNEMRDDGEGNMMKLPIQIPGVSWERSAESNRLRAVKLDKLEEEALEALEHEKHHEPATVSKKPSGLKIKTHFDGGKLLNAQKEK